GREKADAQHAMRDATAEDRTLGVAFIEMERVHIAAHFTEFMDVGFSDFARVSRRLADRQIFNAITRDALSAAHERFPHGLKLSYRSQSSGARDGSPRKCLHHGQSGDAALFEEGAGGFWRAAKRVPMNTSGDEKRVQAQTI